jgi:8-oxo-dGTP pyrophosphatase MutT (NUDIX family)
VSDTADGKQAGRKSNSGAVRSPPCPGAPPPARGALQILLVSSRETRRWVIPKGWQMKGKLDHQAAAQEAYEEAGLDGRIVDTRSATIPI